MNYAMFNRILINSLFRLESYTLMLVHDKLGYCSLIFPKWSLISIEFNIYKCDPKEKNSNSQRTLRKKRDTDDFRINL